MQLEHHNGIHPKFHALLVRLMGLKTLLDALVPREESLHTVADTPLRVVDSHEKKREEKVSRASPITYALVDP